MKMIETIPFYSQFWFKTA